MRKSRPMTGSRPRKGTPVSPELWLPEMSPPITREPPSRRVRLVLIWRLRMVGEPPKLVAAPGRASLSCWEIWRSTSPFAWTRGLISSCTPVFR